jgi:hypothetical protein
MAEAKANTGRHAHGEIDAYLAALPKELIEKIIRGRIEEMR